jgi:hypothetical protein
MFLVPVIVPELLIEEETKECNELIPNESKDFKDKESESNDSNDAKDTE